MNMDPFNDPACTCGRMCDAWSEGRCSCCGGAGQDVRCEGMCWDCRGTGHPHPLEDPECPEHRLTDPPPPPASPNAVTVWCGECDGASDVDHTDWSVETDPLGVDWWVRRLDCGHEEVRAI